jgi:predicted MFS family arabinose efflux permease
MRVVVGLGALCGLPLATRLARFSRPGMVNAMGAIVYGLTLFPLIFMHSIAPAAALYFVTGVIWGPYAAIEATALQQWVPTRQLGRVFGAQRALTITAIPLGGAVGSLALEFASAPEIIGASAIACSLVGCAALCVRPLRRPSGTRA